MCSYSDVRGKGFRRLDVFVEDLLLLLGRQGRLLELIQVTPVDLPPLKIIVTGEVVTDQVVEFVKNLVINVYRVEAFNDPQGLSPTDLSVTGISHLS